MSRFLGLSAVVIVALLGAEAASAQGGGGGGDKPPISVKRVEKFVKRQAKIVGEGQPAVFPNARITARKPHVGCSQKTNDRARRIPRWTCIFFIAIYERSLIPPPDETTVHQSTLRFCETPEGKTGGKTWLTVRRAGPPRKLRIAGGWKMSCALDENAIFFWNNGGAVKYQPNRSEPIPYEVTDRPVPKPAIPTDDLLPPPSGAPAGPFPGPLSVTLNRPASRYAHSSAPSPGDRLEGCYPTFGWVRYAYDPRYWVASCWWVVHSLPSLVFNNTRYFEVYYYAGNDSSGRPIGRLFWSGYR